MQNAAQYSSPLPGARPILMGPGIGPIGAGVSAPWRRLLQQAEMAAPHLQVAAIEGEHGVGKQTLARCLQSRSPLAGLPFHRRDAREWLLRDDPTSITGFIYLDRVDLLAAPGQSLLLGVLKTLQDRPAGKVMLVVSSQVNLRQMAALGQMLPALAFRLTAVRFAIPPLRMRREDIPPIAQDLLERICARYHHRRVELGPGALARLLQHSWPGNVQELASVLESALLEAEDDAIRPCDLPIPGESKPDAVTPAPSQPKDLTLNSLIRRHVDYVLELNRGNKLRSARQLGVSRSTLYRILSNESLMKKID